MPSELKSCHSQKRNIQTETYPTSALLESKHELSTKTTKSQNKIKSSYSQNQIAKLELPVCLQALNLPKKQKPFVLSPNL